MDDYVFLNKKFKKVLYLDPKEKTKKAVFGPLIFLITFIVSFSLCSYLPLQFSSSAPLTASIEENISQEVQSYNNISATPTNDAKENLSPLLKDNFKRTNILLIGVPGEPWPAPYLTDSIEVVSINEEKSNAFVVAIPRDLLVKIPGSNYETRINALFSIEQNPSLLQEKIKEITGLNTHYWAIIDLQLIEELINTIDGIDVVVEEDIYDPKFPTINRGYEVFSISAGPQHLNGEIAIKYIRSRHQAEGDFSRIKRQQQVMDAIKTKILNNPQYLPKILNLFLKNKDKTNIGIAEIKTMIELTKNFSDSSENNSSRIKYFLLDAGKKDSLLVYGKTILGQNTASVLWPRAGKFDYSEIREKIKELEN